MTVLLGAMSYRIGTVYARAGGPYESLENRDMGYSFEPAYRGWITQERRPNGADAPGHLGDPRHALAEKGEYLLQCYTAGVEAFLKKVAAWDGRSWEWSAAPNRKPPA